jgi:hypothetical protein
VQLVLSEDTDIRFSLSGPQPGQDQPLGSFNTGPLEPGQCMTHEEHTSAWAPNDGVWHLGAVADAGNVEPELIESNNTLASGPMGIGFRIDYRIQSVSGPASARPGDPFMAAVTVCNQGTLDGITEVQLVLSEDTDIRFSHSGPQFGQDQPLAHFSTGILMAGQCMTQQVETYAWPPHMGAWYLGAVADPRDTELEFFENNNTRASALMGIGYDSDHFIQVLAAPVSVTMGQPYEATVEVCNQGTSSSPVDVQLVLSEDTDIRISYSGPPEQDLPVEFLSFSNLDPGQCVTQNVTLHMTPPNAGAWYLGAVADPHRNWHELIETNNTRASGIITFQP